MPIMKVLHGERKQTEPLLMTPDGIVINGNRRLAAMRELFQIDLSDYKSFQVVQVAILPSDASEIELKCLRLNFR